MQKQILKAQYEFGKTELRSVHAIEKQPCRNNNCVLRLNKVRKVQGSDTTMLAQRQKVKYQKIKYRFARPINKANHKKQVYEYR